MSHRLVATAKERIGAFLPQLIGAFLPQLHSSVLAVPFAREVVFVLVGPIEPHMAEVT